MMKTITKERTMLFKSMLLLGLFLTVFSFGKIRAQALSGNYTIGSGGTYANIAAALADLNTNGVNGPVTMTILPGTYSVTSTISINNYTGVGASNPLVFEGTDVDSVIFQGTVNSGSIFLLNLNKYVTLRKLTVINNSSTNCSGIAIRGNTSTNVGTGHTINNCKVSLPFSSTSYTSMGILTTAAASGYGTGGNTYCDSLNIDSNTITGAYYGLYLYGRTTIGNTGNREVKIRNNSILDSKYYGMYVYYHQNGLEILNNKVSVNSSAYYGMYIYYCYNHHTGNNPHRIINNQVYNAAYSMYLYNFTAGASNPSQVYNNTLIGRAGIYNYGIYIFTGTTYAGHLNVYHNTSYMLNSTYGYAFYLSGNYAGNAVRVMNNIFALGTTSSGYYAAYFATSPANPAGGQAINNNIYYTTGASAANLMYRGGAYNASNFNTATAGGDSSYVYLPKYSSDGHMFDACNKLGSPIGSFYVPTDRDGQARSVTSPLIGSDEAASLSNNIKVEQILAPSLPMVTGAQDVKAIVKNVGSNTVTSFAVSYTLNNGTPVTQYFSGTLAACDTVSVLFTGSNQITLGSNNSIKVYTEYPNSSTDADATDDTMAIVLKSPLSGTFTIGTGGDYSTFQAAVADLANGVAGPVIFKVLPGSYSGQVVISGQIPGASSTNTITFEGDTASTRILSASVSGAAVFLVNQANYVNIRHLTINNTSTGGTGVAIVGTAGNNYGSNCSIVGNIINMPYQTATSYNISITATVGGNGTSACRIDSITIDSNICTGGYYGISAYGASNGTYNYNFKFRNNTISNMYYMGMNLYYLYNAVDLIGNSVSMPTTSSTVYYGIYMYYCANPTSTPTNIIGNNVNGGYYYQYYIYNTGSSPLNVINNVGGRTTYGYNNGMYLYATTASSATILHNTLTQDYPQSGATYSPFAAYLPSNSIVKNNIFANTATTGTQTPCYLYSAPTASNSINNNIYFNGASTSAIYRGSAYTSSTFNTPLAGGDSSIFVNPKFISNTNYQVTTCYTGGDYTSIVGTDIMGAIRNVPPKIGAYENTTPLSYLSSNTVQMTGLVAPGATDFPVLRIPVAFTGCGDGYTTNFYFNTVGTTSASNIVAAKIYNSGVSAGFNTSNLVGTVYSPSGAFSFTVSDTVNRNFGDTTNYWLAYDVSSSASNGNTLDARIDSFTVLGSSFVPANNNPTGNLVVAAPMTYLGSTASHPKTTYVTPGSSNNEILKIAVITSSTGSPISATSFSLNTTGGGNDTLNISSAKLYYTGNSSTFSTSTLFGSYSVSSPTTSSWPTYAITGSQQLANDTNYFWLAYDIYSGASLGDSVDAEVTAITIGGNSQTPLVSAPAGYRKIRADYCISSATSTADEEIWNVTFGTLNNTTTCTSTTGGPGTVARMYSNFTALAAPAIPAGLATPFSVLTSSCGGNYTSHLVIYIDYNQDGYFTGTGEMAYSSGSFTGSNAGVLKSGTITVPCTALAGETRMRVIYVETSAVPASCGTYTWGETEDYTINIVSGLPSLISAGAVQVTGSTSAGATDVPVMRVPIKVTSSPCNPGVITELTFNTAGTTSASDIVSAKLYKTGNSATFTNTNLLGTIYTPSGSMVFSINDTTVNDTNNYWLAYDISSSAANANVVDARFDSANVFGTYGVPANGNPTGNRVISVPMTYLGSDAIHSELGAVETGSTNNKMLRIMVRGSHTGAPVSVTEFALNTVGGGADSLNIANAKMFYTGSSPVFSSTTQFGATYTPTSLFTVTWPAYSISGVQPLLNDTNYFWLTYDIKSAAITLDSVDAEVTSVTFGGISYTPTTTAPVGRRVIRNPYCASAATTIYDGEILNVTVGGLNNTSTCTTTGGAGSTLNMYSNYTETIAPVSLVSGVAIPFSVHTATCGGNYTGVLGIWIDLNQDGDFTDAGEAVHMSPTFTYGIGNYRTGNITIPCTATPGVTRMRVSQIETGTSPISPCGTYGYGETEDYAVNIINQAASYVSSNATQTSLLVGPGATDVKVLGVPVKVISSSCLPGTITEFVFSTTGTSATASITSAKLYKTATNTFATTNLLGTTYAPAGQFTFMVTDTTNNDTNFYWLAYDVASGASSGDTLDATIDSINVYGSYVIPSNGNPAGRVIVSVPMTYVSSTSTHPELSKVETGSVLNKMLRIEVQTSSTGAPIDVTNFGLSTNGSAAATTNISNARVWYTGTSTTFSTSTQFGTAVTSPNGTFSISGLQSLTNGTNYFWLTYDIPTGATLGDSVDAEVTSITVASSSQTPTITAPTGSRMIRAPYCISAATSTGDEEIFGVSLGSFSNTSTCSTTGTTGSTLSMYSNYTNLAGPIVKQGDMSTINVTRGTCGGFYGEVVSVYIDWNQNGLLTDAGENVYNSSYSTGPGVVSGTFTVPSNAPLGTTRMRVVYVEGTSAPACGTYTWGETEDYNITVEAPVLVSYLWTGATSSDVTVASNWTPTRTSPNAADKLVFDSSTPISLTNVPATTVRAIEVTAGTIVNLSGNPSDVVRATDSVNLGTGSRVNTSTLVLGVGADTANIGVITGTGKVLGTISRYTNSTVTSNVFPLTDANNNDRSMVVTYTTFPASSNLLIGGFVATAPGNNGLPLTDGSLTANTAGINGYWTLGTPMTGGTYTSTINGNGFNGVFNYANLLMLKRTNSTSTWGIHGTHVTTTGSNSAPVLSRTGMTTYGQFGIGGDSISNPLPVSMLFFNANNVSGDVVLKWATANEVNNKGFVIERSSNGNDFQEVSFVKGSGNTTRTIQYSAIDNKAFLASGSTTLYYRLRQEDFDGSISYSDIVMVDENTQLNDNVAVFPNPFVNSVGVNIQTSVSGSAKVELVDMQGRIIATENVNVSSGTTYHELNTSKQLSTGVYFVNVTLNGVRETIKVSKVN